MKTISKVLFNCSMCIMIGAAAHAAGTYPTGAYQSPQTRYSQQGVSSYNRQQYANAGYSTKQKAPVNKNQATTTVADQQSGFTLDAGLSKQTGMWQFEMKEAGSKLHYDNVDWFVFNAGGKYVFGGDTKFQVDAGLQYGVQTGETTMVDDDISHGGYLYGEYYVSLDTDNDEKEDKVVYVGDKVAHALSIGTSEGGSMLGFHAGFGLTDFFSVGKLKITPSVGWRYLKYELKTSNNKGMVFVNGDFDASCMTFADGSMQCAPLVGGTNDTSNGIWFPGYTYFDANGAVLEITANGGFVIAGTDQPAEPVYAAVDVSPWLWAEADGTFYFEQPDVSHSYEVAWSGPYVALDMRYDINPTNVVTANVELGLPSYSAIADQPYRYDWQHPKSIEDKAGVGSGLHLGMGINWATALTDTVAMTVGLTYDYYSVSGVDATTYFNPEYQLAIYEGLVYDMMGKLGTEDAIFAENVLLNGNEDLGFVPNDHALVIKELEGNGWKNTASGEIESFYKSMGIRVGFRAKF